MRLVTVSTLALLACGPLPVAEPGRLVNVSMKNEYAESIFTIDITKQIPAGTTLDPARGPTDTATVRVMNMQRISGFDTERKTEVLRANEAGELAFKVDAISLGDTHSFTGTFKVSESSSLKDTLGFEYDYDLALAKFSLKFGWQ